MLELMSCLLVSADPWKILHDKTDILHMLIVVLGKSIDDQKKPLYQKHNLHNKDNESYAW